MYPTVDAPVPQAGAAAASDFGSLSQPPQMSPIPNTPQPLPMDGTVTLRVYNVGKQKPVAKINDALRKSVKLGVYHVGVEVYGREWGYGAHGGERAASTSSQAGGQGAEDSFGTRSTVNDGDAAAPVTGIFQCVPAQAEGHEYREAVILGKTSLSPEEVEKLLREILMPNWLAQDYDLLKKNCCSFANTFCIALGVDEVPAWVSNLQNIGLKVDAGVTKVRESITKTASELDATFNISEKLAPVTSKIDSSFKHVSAEAKRLDDQHQVTQNVTRVSVKATTAVKDGWAKMGEHVEKIDEQHRVKERLSEGFEGVKGFGKKVGEDVKLFGSRLSGLFQGR